MPDYGGVGERRMLAPKHMLNLEHVVLGEVWNQYVFNIFRKFGLSRWKLLGLYWKISQWYKYWNKINFFPFPEKESGSSPIPEKKILKSSFGIITP